MKTSLKKNDRLDLIITDTDKNGNGVSHAADGLTVFVKNTCAGDHVLAKVIKVLKSYAVAIPEAILQPSADRSAGGCAVAGQCGGCVFQHITYEAECRFKAQTIDAAFERIAKLPIRLSAFHAARSENAYRNKAVYPVGTDKNGLPISGFYAPVSHRIVRHESCAIGQPLFPSVRDAVLAFAVQKNISLYDEQTRKGILRGIYLRAAVSGEMILTLILAAEHFGSQDCERDFCRYIKERFAQICSIVINVNTKSSNAVLGDKWRVLDGDGYLYDELCGKRFRVSPAAFWQVNHAQAEVLYGIAARFAALLPGEKLLDLYCGTGSVGLCIAGADTRLTGVEIVPEAVEDAAFNALLNGMDAQFLCLDATCALEDPRLLALAPDVITIDPPRKGCGVDSARKIAALGAKRIVYISCDPATLARDLAAFADCGYLPLKAEGVDMFPRTAHVECVVLMSKVQK